MGYVTEDRRRRGLFARLSAGANITICYLRSLARLGILSPGRERPAAAAAAREFDVRAPAGLTQPAGTLSGGNQQKLLLARLLLRPRRLLILDEPTRGIDIGAKTEIYALIARLASEGKAILLVSSEMNEILALSDRILVIREGAVAAEVVAGRTTPEEILSYAMPK